jgi:hypothetical protein
MVTDRDIYTGKPEQDEHIFAYFSELMMSIVRREPTPVEKERLEALLRKSKGKRIGTIKAALHDLVSQFWQRDISSAMEVMTRRLESLEKRMEKMGVETRGITLERLLGIEREEFREYRFNGERWSRFYMNQRVRVKNPKTSDESQMMRIIGIHVDESNQFIYTVVGLKIPWLYYYREDEIEAA